MLLCIMLLHCVHRGLGQSMTPTTRSCSKWGWGRRPRSLTQLVRSCSTLLAGVWSMTRTRGPRRWSCFLTRFWRWVTICSITITNSFTLQIRWKLELLSQLKWIKHFVFPNANERCPNRLREMMSVYHVQCLRFWKTISSWASRDKMW